MAHQIVTVGDTATLYHGDCLVDLPSIASKSVNLILADLPYGTTASKWDSLIPLVPLWKEYKRVLAPGGAIVLFAAQPFTTTLIINDRSMFRYSWVWVKQKPTNFLKARVMPLRAHEDILIFAFGQTVYNPQGLVPVNIKSGRVNKSARGVYQETVGSADYIQKEGNFPRSVLFFDTDTRSRLHPNGKPVALLEYLIKTYSNEGDLVLDNAAGSFSTGVACLRTNREFIGMELHPLLDKPIDVKTNPDYFNIGLRRMRDERLALARYGAGVGLT